MRKYLMVLGVLALMAVLGPSAVFAGSSGAVKAEDYTYSVTPVMEPFNLFFFVKTDNPDPRTFRFEDKSSVYRSRPYILNNTSLGGDLKLYADVDYEDESTGRVSGGYIFYGGGTDGGEVVLEVSHDPDAYYQTWEDTNIKISLPALKDGRDYLIDTYANKGTFFENMDAVQSGLSSICLYSGSFVRGRLNKICDYWLCGLSPHVDQTFYIYSPYERLDNRNLFASAVYPYLLDSWGFPGMMESVAEALSSSATCEWSDTSHSQVNVTYNGETHTYGGQGSHEGQSITEDSISRRFSFGTGSTGITLAGIRSTLVGYSELKIEDDLPRDDALTWKQIYDTVGGGAWARVSPGGKNPSSAAFSYFFQDGDGDSFDTSEHELGTSLYWGGDLNFASDAWVDGRYVGKWEGFVRGATFQDHPESSIILKDVKVPQIPSSYRFVKNETTGAAEMVYYVTGDITEETRTVVYKYQNGEWAAWNQVFGDGCASYEAIKQMAERGVIDSKYLDPVQLTRSEVDALDVDRNTDVNPERGYVYDGTRAPGTPYDESAGHSWNKGAVDVEPGCATFGYMIYTCLVCGETKREVIGRKGHDWGSVTYTWSADLGSVTAVRTCRNDSSHVESETVDAVASEVAAASCESPGRVRYTASFSNSAFESVTEDVEVSALGHSWGACEIVSAPTSTAEGVRKYTCARCGGVRTEAIPKVVDEITPTISTTNKATLDESIPKVDAETIKTSGSAAKGTLKVEFGVVEAASTGGAGADASDADTTDPSASDETSNGAADAGANTSAGNADNFMIQYRIAGTETPLYCWTAGKTSCTIEGLQKKGLYQLRIIGFARQVDWTWKHGPWSNVIYRYMGTVKIKKLTPGKKKLTVKWTKDSAATGYLVQYSRKKNMSGAKTVTVKSGAKSKCTIKKLKKGKKYFVKVMPVVVRSGKTYTGILSGVKKAKVK